MQASTILSRPGLCSRQCTCPLAFSALPARARASRRADARQLACRAALDSATTLAVTQQGIAFVVVALAEANFQRSQLPESTKGRPNVLLVGLSCAALLAGVGLVNTGQEGPGLALGTGASALLLAQAIQRTIAVPDDPQNWPGPKVWPATASLLSFFAVNIFVQALSRA